jgi:tetratricopeptide (TPR) repeat protein
VSLIAHYCQKCLAANPLGQELCSQCGTPLMIVVERAATRYETLESRAFTEEHLLERISALENRLGRLGERVERALDLLLQQAQNSHFDRALIKALVGLLTDEQIVEPRKLESLWIGRCQKDAEEQLESERREALQHKILAAYSGPQKSPFQELVDESFLLLEEEQNAKALQGLQRAARMDRNNGLLQYYVGECLFKSGKLHKARSYLARAHELMPVDQRVSLLLGLACADEGDVESAKALLSAATKLGGSSFAAHYGLGRVFVAESKWRQAIQEFKLALASKVSPEAHYALGCLYYQLSRDVLATRHLRKALELDENYSGACHVLGLIAARAGSLDVAESYFRQAGGGKTKRKANGNRTANEIPALLSNGVVPFDSKKLVSGGDRRLAEAVRRDALTACTSGAFDSF